jgi:hypothetical protein
MSLLPEDDPKIMACCVLFDILTQFYFGEFPHPSLVMNTPTIVNDHTSRNPMDLHQVSMEAKQLPDNCLSSYQETSDSGTCG